MSRLPFDDRGQHPVLPHHLHSLPGDRQTAAHLLHPHHSRLSEQVQDFTKAAKLENARLYLIVS